MARATATAWQVQTFGQAPSQAIVNIPNVPPFGARIKVSHCGVCHTDLHLRDGYYSLGDGERMNFADRGVTPPLILGHEICGTIESIGDAAATSISIGERVAVYPWIGCGHCAVCGAGKSHLCAAPAFLGFWADGGYSDFITVPDVTYLELLGGLDPATVAPLSCAGLTAMTAFEKLPQSAKDTGFAIIGFGGVGQMISAIARAHGYKTLSIIDASAAKRRVAQAQELAAFNAVEDAGALNAVIDTVASGQTAQASVSALARGGVYIAVGLFGGAVSVPTAWLSTKLLTLTGAYAGSLGAWRRLFALAKKGTLQLPPVETRPMGALPETFSALESGTLAARVAVTPESA